MDDKQITLRMPKELHEALKKMSDETGITVSNLVVFAILHRMSNQTSTESSSDRCST